MIEELEELRSIDNDIFEEFQKANQYLPWLLRESPIPKTVELFYIYLGSTNFIKNSIFDCAENEDIYSVNILFRSIVEHFLRFQYIWFNYCQGGKEEFSIRYYTALNLSEQLSYLKAANAVNALNKGKVKTTNEIWADLQQHNPKALQSSINEIENFSKSISIKNIIKFIEQNIESGKLQNNGFLKDLILRYSTLSSFVHGGISAHHNIVNYEKSNKRNHDLVIMCGLALQTASFVKLFSFLIFYQVKPEFGDIYNKTHEFIKEIE
ncbi:MAG: DUF5677 domain-containing protein [Bacteroidota bacterium]|nr:DUF5677 domain-containing protein [Bacteroidota bacterium]